MCSKSIVEDILRKYVRNKINVDTLFFTTKNYGVLEPDLNIYKNYYTYVDDVLICENTIEEAINSAVPIILYRQINNVYNFIIIGINSINEIFSIDPITIKEYRIKYSITLVVL